jgi:hypothetical protein
MVGMSPKKPSEIYKLPARSAPAVVDAFGLLKLRFERKLTFHGRKVSGEAILNGIVLDFLDKPFEEQGAVLARRVPEFEAMFAGGPLPGPKDSGPAQPMGQVKMDSAPDPKPKQARRKGSSAVHPKGHQERT